MTHLRYQPSRLRAGLFAQQHLPSQRATLKNKKIVDDILLLTVRDKPYISKKLRVRLWLLPVVAFVLLFVVISAQANVDQQPDWEAISGGELWLTNDENQRIPALLTQTSMIDVKVNGLLAKVRLTQTFTNPSSEWVEGEYLFPLPEKSAIHRFEVQVGERKIVGVVKEKNVAKRIYTEAKAAGKKAGMLTQQRPNLFTSNVANIGPEETVSVVIEYIEQVRFDHGVFRLRIPTTLTPRYLASSSIQKQVSGLHNETLDGRDEMPEQPIVLNGQGWQGGNEEITGAFGSSGGNAFSLDASIDMQMPLGNVESLYHSIRLNKQDTGYQLSLANGEETMNRDVVLEWQVVAGAMPKIGLFMEQVDGEDYGLLMMLPPSAQASKNIAKERVYIIDTSGSMGGASIRQAKQALLQSLSRLSTEDSFNIIEFNSITSSLFPHPVPATSKMLNRANHFIHGLEASGGTEMLPALQQALSNPAMQASGALGAQYLDNQHERVRQVIFITDGAVSNELALMEKVQKSLGNQRLFTVGIGAAPNSYFMRKIAEFGRGTFTYIGHVNEVQEKMDALLRQLESPQLTDIHIQWPEGTDVEHYPAKIPDLYAGEPLLLVVKSKPLSGAVGISGRLASKKWSQSLSIEGSSSPLLSEMAEAEASADDTRGEKGIAKRWAREKIANLLDQKIIGKSPDIIRDEVLAVALKYQVMSPFTRFIAVEEAISRPSTEGLKKGIVQHKMAAKNSAKNMQYPKTSNGINLMFSAGFVLLAFFLYLLLSMREKATSRSA